MVVDASSGCLSLLKDQSIDKTVMNETLVNLKLFITQNCDSMLLNYANVQKFINGHETYDLSGYSDRTHVLILSDKAKADTFVGNLKVAIAASQVNSKAKLAAISITKTIDVASPIVLYPSLQYTLILNDLLDASGYTLKGINPNDGSALIVTDEQKKQLVKGYLNQFQNFMGIAYASWLQPEVDLMMGVKDYILSNLNSIPLLDLANYIDANIEKVPLIRRNWTLG
jgi:hypothetical protein